MIPRHLHFIFGLAPAELIKSGSDSQRNLITGWGLTHYVCVRSAIEKIKPDLVSFYLENEPSGPWWEITKPLVDVINVKGPTEIFGNPVNHYAHKADVIRLERLIRHGGIYLDVDVIVHDSFDEMLSNSTVMGLEGEGGLCNAVILAEKESPFLLEWYDNYRSFDDVRWSYHSVLLPFELSKKPGSQITIMPEEAFFIPGWRAKGIYTMFAAKSRDSVRGVFANHLWEQRARYYLGGLTPGHVRRVDSAFHLWARPYLQGLPDDFGTGTNWLFMFPRHAFAKGHNMARMCKEILS